jgi:hypothetical protein
MPSQTARDLLAAERKRLTEALDALHDDTDVTVLRADEGDLAIARAIVYLADVLWATAHAQPLGSLADVLWATAEHVSPSRPDVP